MQLKTWTWTLAALLALSPAGSAEEPAQTGDKIPAGYRGIALPVPGYQLPFLKKGDRVDVLVTFDAVIADKSKEKVTATIMQNVLVRGLRQPKDLEGKGAVELVLNQNETQYAALAVMQGELQIAVRPEGDKEMKPMEMASLRKLFR
jgi:Flp pilus assembly protein CpaB